MELILWEEELRGGQSWSHILDRGMAIRMTDTEGGANVAALFYNAAQTDERYNMPDTLKAQHVARLTKGNVLYSDMGRILCSITGDTVGWHDPLGGTLNAAQLAAKYGERSYQTSRNEWTQPPLEHLLIELGKYSMGPRDLTPTVNFFSKVEVDGTGRMRHVAGNSPAGGWVELRAEMKVLVVLSANPHPLEPGSEYEPKPVRLTVKRVDPAGPEDACRVSRPENARGFELTARYSG
jgi:urea carboxylase-associated protein 2